MKKILIEHLKYNTDIPASQQKNRKILSSIATVQPYNGKSLYLLRFQVIGAVFQKIPSLDYWKAQDHL